MTVPSTTHIIHFLRGINAETLAGFQNVALSALNAGATAIRIHMSSEGGSNNQAFAAYHLIRSLPVPVTTHCIGNVESMAVLMYLAGARRLVVPHGKFNIHPMHWGFAAGTVDHDRMVEYVDVMNFDAKRYSDIYEERTAGSEDVVDVRSHLAGKARLLDANGAIDAGIAMAIDDAQIPSDSVRWWV
jgi:ATP-dependent protease ClpP protease subunit